jgi:hypothetical protein
MVSAICLPCRWQQKTSVCLVPRAIIMMVLLCVLVCISMLLQKANNLWPRFNISDSVLSWSPSQWSSVNCEESVPQEHSTSSTIPPQPPELQQPCSLAFLKSYAIHFHDYATLPFDRVDKYTSEKPPGNYSCWFPDKSLVQAMNIQSRCEMKQPDNFRIVIMGDSNAARFSHPFMGTIQDLGWQCSTTKTEQSADPTQPDPNYFVREPSIKLEHLKVKQRGCHGCRSFQVECKKEGGKTLSIEYLATQFLLDSEVTTLRMHSMCAVETFCEHSDTYQEFIFREYLVDRYPDVLLFFASDHDKNRHTLKRMRLAAHYFFSIIDAYLPANSTVIVMNVMKQLTQHQPQVWRDAVYERGMLTNELIQAENAMLYEVMHDKLVQSDKRWYAFPTLYDSTNATDHLYADAVHRAHGWYHSIALYLNHLLCVT